MLRGFAAIRRAVLKRCFAAFLVVAAVGTVLGTSGTAQNSPPSASEARQLTDELMRAITNRDPSAVAEALKRGANPNRSAGEVLPLGQAAALGQLAIMRTLLDAGADVQGGEVPAVAIAAAKDDGAMVIELVRRGADVNRRFGRGGAWTPLFWAALLDAAPGCAALLAQGAEPNALNLHPPEKYLGQSFSPAKPRGRTALMVAASLGYVHTVRVLLERGADPSLRNEEGATALSVTSEYESPIDAVRSLLLTPPRRFESKK